MLRSIAGGNGKRVWVLAESKSRLLAGKASKMGMRASPGFGKGFFPGFFGFWGFWGCGGGICMCMPRKWEGEDE